MVGSVRIDVVVLVALWPWLATGCRGRGNDGVARGCDTRRRRTEGVRSHRRRASAAAVAGGGASTPAAPAWPPHSARARNVRRSRRGRLTRRRRSGAGTTSSLRASGRPARATILMPRARTRRGRSSSFRSRSRCTTCWTNCARCPEVRVTMRSPPPNDLLRAFWHGAAPLNLAWLDEQQRPPSLFILCRGRPPSARFRGGLAARQQHRVRCVTPGT